MKSTRSLVLALCLLTPAALVISVGCSKSNDTKAADAVQDTKTAIKDAAKSVSDSTVDTWNHIKDYTFDKRSDFSTSIDNATRTMDEKLADLKAKMTPDSPEKTKARQEYDEARAQLKEALTNLGNATADTWASAKTQVAKAWDRVQASYDKLQN